MYSPSCKVVGEIVSRVAKIKKDVPIVGFDFSQKQLRMGALFK